MIARFLGVILLGVFLASSIAYAQSPTDNQAPPSPPHTFFGHDPLVDGVQVPNGTIVTALSPQGADVGSAPVESGTFVVQVDAAVASSVQFLINGATTAFFAVESGGLTELTVDISTGTPPTGDPEPPPPVTGGDPNGLPNGGNGGLAQAGSTGNVLLILGASMAALIAVIGRREWSLRT
jgi:hypothetical protein